MLGDPNLQFPSVSAPIFLPFHPLAPVFGPAVLCPIGDRFAPGLVSRSLRRPSNRPLFRIMIVVFVDLFGSSKFSGRDCAAVACSLRPDVTNEVEICPKESVWLRVVSPVCSYGEKSDPEGPKQGGIIEKYRRRTGQRHKSCGWCFVFAR